MTDTAAEQEVTDPARGFAQLMGKAKETAESVRTEEAPYGYTTDADGTVRPKKTAGRPRKSPSLDELKESREAAGDGGSSAGTADRAPDEKSRRRVKSGKTEEKKSYPQFREGVIEKGINRAYRKAGKIVRVWDQATGQALIDITRSEDPDDITVGKAWEEIARTNPRIRKFLLRMINGGNWGQLVMAHAPVFLALFIRFRLGERLPMGRFMEAFMDNSDGEAPSDGTPLEGLVPADMAQMGGLMDQAMQMAQQFMAQQGTRVGDQTGRSPQPPPAGPDPFAAAVAAKAAANGQPLPRGLSPVRTERRQPKRTARSGRR